MERISGTGTGTQIGPADLLEAYFRVKSMLHTKVRFSAIDMHDVEGMWLQRLEGDMKPEGCRVLVGIPQDLVASAMG